MLDTQQTILNTHEITSHVCYIIIYVQGTHNCNVTCMLCMNIINMRMHINTIQHITVYKYIIVYLHTHILTLPSFFQLYLF